MQRVDRSAHTSNLIVAIYECGRARGLEIHPLLPQTGYVDSPTVVCPLCNSNNVHKTGETMDLAIYACDACKAQFTVQVPRPAKRSPS